MMLTYVLTLGQATGLWAQGDPVLLTGPTPAAEFTGHVSYLRDPDGQMGIADVLAGPAPGFAPLGPGAPDFGYTSDRIWLRAILRNDSRIQDWVIHFPENFKQIFEVYLQRGDGTVEPLMQLDRDSPFTARELSFPEMATRARIAPGEEVVLLIRLWSEGSSYIVFSLESRESFEALASERTARNFTFYGMMLLLVVMALICFLFLRNPLFLAYAAYATSGLLYVMHVDGVAFQYLWPQAPRFNGMASVYTGAGIICFGAIYARMFLKTARFHPVMDRVLLVIVLSTLGLIAGLVAVNPQLLKKLLVLMSLVAILSFVLAGVVASLSRFREVRFYLIAWVGVFVSAMLMNLNHILGVDIDPGFLYDSMRAAMVFDAMMMGLAIADGYNQMRQSRQGALQARLRTAQQNLGLRARLSSLEERFHLLSDLAQDRDEQFENAVHDLRQPLHSLRLNVGQLIAADGSGQGAEVARIDAAFGYLERLIGEALATDVTRDLSAPKGPDAGDVLTQVAEMFRADACAKGLTLRVEAAPVALNAPPLALMRILSNLVANAIKYTAEGGIELRAFADAEGACLSVCDSGPGMSAAEFEAALGRHVRLEGREAGAEGVGLGLAIAREMAEAADLRLRWIAQPGGGTRIDLRPASN